ncbi:hypothetical protein HanHA300_Chr14g0511031 [Helianthus annuus]|nr:hypothetical protein HanHA300_Chr14g0511031 [Helianthus annuus]
MSLDWFELPNSFIPNLPCNSRFLSCKGNPLLSLRFCELDFVFLENWNVTSFQWYMTMYNEPLFFSRAMTIFPLTTFQCPFSNLTSCPRSSNWPTEINKLFRPGIILTSLKVHEPSEVFKTMSPMPVTLSTSSFANFPFPKSHSFRFCSASLLWVA